MIVGDRMLHTEWIEDFGFQEVGEGLTRDDRHDHRQQHISYTAMGVLRADGKLQSCQARRPFEYGFVGDAIDVNAQTILACHLATRR